MVGQGKGRSVRRHGGIGCVRRDREPLLAEKLLVADLTATGLPILRNFVVVPRQILEHFRYLWLPRHVR